MILDARLMEIHSPESKRSIETSGSRSMSVNELLLDGTPVEQLCQRVDIRVEGRRIASIMDVVGHLYERRDRMKNVFEWLRSIYFY